MPWIAFMKTNKKKGDTRLEAKSLAEKMEQLEFSLMLELWSEVLQRFQDTSKSLQEENITLSTCANLYESLQQYLSQVRDQFNEFEKKAMNCLPGTEYRQHAKRQSIRKKQPDDGSAPEHDFSPREKFRVTAFLPIVDALCTNLERRAGVYKSVATDFEFVTQLDMPKHERDICVKKLVKVYSDDLDDNLASELAQFHEYVKVRNTNGAAVLNGGK